MVGSRDQSLECIEDEVETELGVGPELVARLQDVEGRELGQVWEAPSGSGSMRVPARSAISAPPELRS